jgi:dsDNA-specific endonuclease/ATPase MutS2
LHHSGSSDDGREDEPWEPEPFVVPIEDSIDLHHFQPKEILDVVDAYLDAAIERGILEVRLIHGRGKGVQRARVQALLASDPRVVRFEEAPAGRGGWGATLAWLHPTPDGES